jgi:hypothetical protein
VILNTDNFFVSREGVTYKVSFSRLKSSVLAGVSTGGNGPAGPPGPKGDKGDTGPAGVGVPVGGATGQVLAKVSATDFDTTWITPTGSGGATWGDISGTLSAQTDLQSALDGKASTAQGALADTALQPGAVIPWADVSGKPTFATVATSGAYSDLSGLPSLFDGAWGSLSGVPSTFTPSAHSHALSDLTQSGASSGQVPQWNGSNWVPASVSGGSATWGGISGTLSDQTDLQTTLDGKQPIATVLTNTTASFTTAQETKLSGIATGATANQTDAHLLNRANHTGTQAASTITGLATVATSGAYGDLSGLPSLFDGAWGSLSGIPAVISGTTASFTTAQETKLAGIATGATANQSDAHLLNRANHTGTQATSTVSGLDTALADRVKGVVRITVGTTAPGSPATNDLWVDTN